MTKKDKEKHVTTTTLDPRMARPRLKEGLIPPETGLFLRVEKGNDQGRAITLSSGGTYVIGRDGADIAIDDTKVSRRHAEIALLGTDAYFLRDLASTNGTFLNGKRVHDRQRLADGDIIRIGDTTLMFAVVEGSLRIGGR